MTMAMEHAAAPRAWTRDEDARVRRLRALGAADQDIAAAMGRSVKAVRSRAARIDDPHGFRDRAWRADEIAALRFGVEQAFTASEMAAELGRPRRVVIAEARRLGLSFGGAALATVSNSTAVRRIRAARAGEASFETLRRWADLALPKPSSAEAIAYDAERAAQAVSFADLDRGQCRFAVTGHGAAPGEHRFCAADVVNRLVGSETHPHANYCAHHAARVVVRAE